VFSGTATTRAIVSTLNHTDCRCGENFWAQITRGISHESGHRTAERRPRRGAEGIVDWARRAEAAGFTSLGTIDRIAYPDYESLVALAAAAAVTERIELVTDILIAPVRTNTARLAKQAATLDHLSGGRLVLGVAPGGREDDYSVGGVDFGGRGKVLDEQLSTMKAIWEGRTAVGPEPGRPGGPVLLVGGSSAPSFRRGAAWRRLDDGGRDAGHVRRRARHPPRGLEGRGAPRASRARWRCSTSRSAPTPRRSRSAASATTPRSSATTRRRSWPAPPRTPAR
jgi:hypothetical protein